MEICVIDGGDLSLIIDEIICTEFTYSATNLKRFLNTPSGNSVIWLLLKSLWKKNHNIKLINNILVIKWEKMLKNKTNIFKFMLIHIGLRLWCLTQLSTTF